MINHGEARNLGRNRIARALVRRFAIAFGDLPSETCGFCGASRDWRDAAAKRSRASSDFCRRHPANPLGSSVSPATLSEKLCFEGPERSEPEGRVSGRETFGCTERWKVLFCGVSRCFQTVGTDFSVSRIAFPCPRHTDETRRVAVRFSTRTELVRVSWRRPKRRSRSDSSG